MLSPGRLIGSLLSLFLLTYNFFIHPFMMTSRDTTDTSDTIDTLDTTDTTGAHAHTFVARSIHASRTNASRAERPHISSDGRKRLHTSGRSGLPKSAQR